MGTLEQLYKKQFRELPNDVQQVISNAHLNDKIQAIGKKHDLRVDQVGALADETMIILLGLEPSSDYQKNLERELNVTPEQAKALAGSANEEIFKPIRSSLMKIQRAHEQQREEMKSGEQSEEEMGAVKEKLERPTRQKPAQKERPRYTVDDDPYREPINEDRDSPES